MSHPRRKRYESADLERHLEALRQATGTIAHGLNNRLTAVAGFLDLARDSVLTGRSPVTDLNAAVGVVMSSAEHVAELRAFASQASLTTTTRDLGRLIRALTETIDASLGDRVQLELDLHPESGAVAVDPDSFQKVLCALATNARDAMPGGGTLTLRTAPLRLTARTCADRFSLLEPGGYVELTLTDTGVGMDAAVLERCLDPYFTTKLAPSNSGLGLSSCYGIVRQMEGLLEIESAPDQGTLVRMLLPQVTGA